jgi:CRP/FNR family cyclic AMP-dependent transcriptional regulator
MTEINIFRSSADTHPVEAGEILFSEGDLGTEMFAVIEGEIELTRHGSVIEVVGPGGILGELALIDTAPRSAAARARTSARVVRVDQRQFTFLVHEHPTFALQVMAVMAERLRKTNETLSMND